MKRITFSGFLLLLGLAAASCGSENYSSNSPDMSLIPVKTGGKWGYIDRKGQFVIAPRFDRADVFYEGRARVVSYANKKSTSGYIDQEGNAVTPVRFDYATGFSDGIAWVSTAEGAPTAIASDGRELFTLRQAIWAHRYSEGLARVVEAHDDTLLHCTFYDTQGRKAIDLTGLAPANPDLAGFSCGRFPVMDSSGRCGYIDREGKLAVPCRFDMALPFESDGLAAVRTGGKWGTIGLDGKYRIAPRFSDIQAWGEIYAVRLDGEKWGYADKEGNILSEPQFAEASPFVSGDLAAATADGKLWGYVDRKGKWAIEPQFERAHPFLGDIAPVSSGQDAWGFIGKDGRFVIEPQFEFHDVSYGGPVFHDAARRNYFDAGGTAERIVGKSPAANPADQWQPATAAPPPAGKSPAAFPGKCCMFSRKALHLFPKSAAPFLREPRSPPPSPQARAAARASSTGYKRSIFFQEIGNFIGNIHLSLQLPLPHFKFLSIVLTKNILHQ